jgi:hypothetical protein
MSAEPTKMDSSACHFFCTSFQQDMTLSTVPSFFCQLATASRNTGLVCTYFWPDMFCSCRLSLSSASTMASSICKGLGLVGEARGGPVRLEAFLWGEQGGHAQVACAMHQRSRWQRLLRLSQASRLASS